VVEPEDREKPLEDTLFSHMDSDEAGPEPKDMEFFDCRFKRDTGPYSAGKRVYRIKWVISQSRMEVFEEKDPEDHDTPDEIFDLYLMPIMRHRVALKRSSNDSVSVKRKSSSPPLPDTLEPVVT